MDPDFSEEQLGAQNHSSFGGSDPFSVHRPNDYFPSSSYTKIPSPTVKAAFLLGRPLKHLSPGPAVFS